MSLEPFQREPATVQCRCGEYVEIKGLQSEWPKCKNGHEIRCPDLYFCWQPKACITAGRCKGLRACND